MKLRPQIIKPLLSALDAKILIIAAHLFDAFIEDNKIHNKAAFDALYQHKSEIESKLGTELQWNRGDDIKSSKVFIQLDNVSIENEDDWPQMAKFHAEWSKKFYDLIVPYITVDWQ